MSTGSQSRCPSCNLPEEQLEYSDELVVAVRDGHPVSPGHTLVIPRRHIPDWFSASPWEQQAIWQAVKVVKESLDASHRPDGYNIGFNAGAAAGQTVMHLHVHVIPRYEGDTADPRGGVRGVIPASRRDDADGALEASRRDPFAALRRFVPGESDGPLKPQLSAALRQADEVDWLVAFIWESGLLDMEAELVRALERDARVRVLTSDYSHATEARALRRLLRLQEAYACFEARFYKTPTHGSFHPKAYIFAKGPYGAAYVGSSNISQRALNEGVEWNLKTATGDGEVFTAIRHRFEALFKSGDSRALSEEVIADYEARVAERVAAKRAEIEHEIRAGAPTPRPIQAEVLARLAAARDAGEVRGLVVMATGLGKTFLSAFDFQAMGGRRALFVAHREEILTQAEATWRRVLPERSTGFLRGGEHQPEAELLFASVQTLSRMRHLRQFAQDHFDYVVIDEFHHAAASSYRKLLAWFKPKYLLGLTATPDRLDGADLLSLCHDNLVARVGLTEGIAHGDLVPFRYHGLRDELDFKTIPWRSGRFDKKALTEANATHERAEQALAAYRRLAPSRQRRTLVFCCTQAHADFIAEHFNGAGVKSRAVHSGATSAPRAESVEALRRGDIEAIVAVDIFNEGVDLPDVNTILMLRPTESPVIFLQQLGRGLRPGKTIEKDALTVIDFIGNHRSFLTKPQALLALVGLSVPPGDALRRIQRGLGDELPEGCEVSVEVEAIDMLAQVARLSDTDRLLHTYMNLRDKLGRRPTGRELVVAGGSLSALARRYGAWFDLPGGFHDLSDAEASVLAEHRAWFTDLLKTQMSKSYKMVVLAVLIEDDMLWGEVDVKALAARCRQYIRQRPLLHSELGSRAGLSDAAFASQWREMPLLVLHKGKSLSRQWFALDGERFVSKLEVLAEHRLTFEAMTEEMVAMRLQDHVIRRRLFTDEVLPSAAPIELSVRQRHGNPVLWLDRARRPDLPTGSVAVVADNVEWVMAFGDRELRSAQGSAQGPNALPRLLRRWFGPTAGLPGTRHHVRLTRRDGGWRLTPVPVEGQAPPVRVDEVPYYEQLAVACGVAMAQVEAHDVARPISVESGAQLDPTRHFVVRASGDSMNGGALPIKDGDLVLCEWMEVTDPRQVIGQPVLLTGGDSKQALAAFKIPKRRGGRWVLCSSNPAHPEQPVPVGTTLRIVARPLEVVTERRGLTIWGRYDRDAIAASFNQRNSPYWRQGHIDLTVGGEPHTVLMINLRKPAGTPEEHRYADRFLNPASLQWESQATTTTASAKGRRILGHAKEGRRIHLFIRYHPKDRKGSGEDFIYCGTAQTRRHQGEAPVRVWFELDHPLPEALYAAWNDF